MADVVKLDSKQRASFKLSVKQKLQDLGKYIDEELPEYVMVMVGNSRSHAQMASDLKVFLGSSTVVFTDWLFQKLSKLSSDATNESDSREGTPLLDEKPAVKSPAKPPVKPMQPVVMDARDVIRSKQEDRDDHRDDRSLPKTSVLSSVVTVQPRPSIKPANVTVRNASLLTRAIADATKSTREGNTRAVRTSARSPDLTVREPARVIADVNNGVVARRPVHERLGNRVGRIEEPYVEDISSDEEDKGPSVKKSKRSDDEEQPDSPKFIVTLDGAKGMFDNTAELSDSDDEIQQSRPGSVFSRIGTIASNVTTNSNRFLFSKATAPPRFPTPQTSSYPSFRPQQPNVWQTIPFRPRHPVYPRTPFRTPNQYKLVKNQFPSRDKLKWTAPTSKPSVPVKKPEPDTKTVVGVPLTVSQPVTTL
ncbi:zinc finger CCCH domain-containing protein 14-like [Corticium candelabrum]|uniref:zinc finger CCCH domain-containing protein 14-like n=1 Tax=Corticium candelabrum TaxID=121492 RepID=UPI002E26F517|nr:zinc finger CCCH domain-containing protein 14-like [Corticium candelabrum]